MVMRGDGKTITELASEAGVGRSYFTRILRLSFLAPDITTMILRGRQPLEHSAKQLTSDTRLPVDWHEQRTNYSLSNSA